MFFVLTLFILCLFVTQIRPLRIEPVTIALLATAATTAASTGVALSQGGGGGGGGGGGFQLLPPKLMMASVILTLFDQMRAQQQGREAKALRNQLIGKVFESQNRILNLPTLPELRMDLDDPSTTIFKPPPKVPFVPFVPDKPKNAGLFDFLGLPGG